MGRILSYAWMEKSKYDKCLEYYKKLEEAVHGHKRMCDCEECEEFYSSSIHDSLGLRDQMKHQFKFHDLPYEGVFTADELRKMLETYVKDKKYYEAQVVAMVLNEYYEDEEDEDIICVFNYD